MRNCPQCTCSDDNACLTTRGACSWVDGSDLCSACLFPSIFLSGPQIDEARTLAPEGPLTVGTLCQDALTTDGENVRWFWGVYGRELRLRLETTLRHHYVAA